MFLATYQFVWVALLVALKKYTIYTHQYFLWHFLSNPMSRSSATWLNSWNLWSTERHPWPKLTTHREIHVFSSLLFYLLSWGLRSESLFHCVHKFSHSWLNLIGRLEERLRMIAISGFIVSRIKRLEYGIPSIVNLCAVIQKQKYLHC